MPNCFCFCFVRLTFASSFFSLEKCFVFTKPLITTACYTPTISIQSNRRGKKPAAELNSVSSPAYSEKPPFQSSYSYLVPRQLFFFSAMHKNQTVNLKVFQRKVRPFCTFIEFQQNFQFYSCDTYSILICLLFI